MIQAPKVWPPESKKAWQEFYQFLKAQEGNDNCNAKKEKKNG